MRAIYGPVPSWRLGRSLGVDLISGEKVCSFDCIYCQLGKTREKSVKRGVFVQTDKIRTDLSDLLDTAGSVDIITFSGMGEPTLASNLQDVIEVIRKITDLPLAILTNSSFLHLKEVQNTLEGIDKVVAKLDASEEELFQRMNRPHASISFEKLIKGIEEFRRGYEGEFELQMMFTDENRGYAEAMASLAAEIKPERVEVNTPLRPCPVKPLGREEIKEIKEIFERKGLDTISVYESEKIEVEPVNHEEMRRRRPG